MSRTPSRSEVSGWSPMELAHYLRQMNLTGCDTVVVKNSISGSRFLDLSENDLQKFPKLCTPLICKISTEISRKDQSRRFFPRRSPAPMKYLDPAEHSLGWADDEFDDVGDSSSDENDYVDPNSSEDDIEEHYEDPPTELCEDLNHLRVGSGAKLGTGIYSDKQDHQASAKPPDVLPRPPTHSLTRDSRREAPPHVRNLQAPSRVRPEIPSGLEKPQIFRDKKPGREPAPSALSGARIKTAEPRRGSNRAQMELPGLQPHNKAWTGGYEEDRQVQNASKRSTFPPPRCRPAEVLSQGNSLPVKAASPVPGEVSGRRATSQQVNTGAQDLDSRWYVGILSRIVAEGHLRDVNKDGSFLVRDSTKKLASQPFTLMVLYHNKVYNIQIRAQGHMFQLGTGLKVQETFPSVSDIIQHYSTTPLLLIDAKNRGAGQQNQCVLSHPAGRHAVTQTGRTYQ